MAFSSVLVDYTPNSLKQKAVVCNFAANDLTGTVYVGFNRIVSFCAGLIGTAAAGTGDAHPQLRMVGTAFDGTVSGTSIGIPGGTVAFTRGGAGTSLASSYGVVVFGW